jgi:hypothetical protein
MEEQIPASNFPPAPAGHHTRATGATQGTRKGSSHHASLSPTTETTTVVHQIGQPQCPLDHPLRANSTRQSSASKSCVRKADS